MPRIAPAPNRGSTAWAQQDNSLKGPWTFRTKEKVQCLCEGGRGCTRENPLKQKGGNAISGMHCSWVGDQQMILAAARPWQENVVKFGLVDVFIKHNIGMILNLQEVGEHDSCGPGNLKTSGFSYDPESFMSARVGFYNFSWRDMGVPDLDRMMDIVQVMDYVTGTEGRKILVHCHAGLGRTGLAIACYFLYTQQYSGRRAIEAVRQDRPGALQTRQQEMFVYIFEQYLAHLRCVFSGAELAAEERRAASPTKPRTKTPSVSGAPQARLSRPGNVQSTSDMGTPSRVHESGGMRHESYDSGLQIVRPINLPTPGVAAASSVAAITEDDIGLDHQLPWTANFHIQPNMFTREWQPVAPRTYAEALKRQQRLLHGPERRTYMHLHRFVKECAFAVIAAASAHTGAPSPAPTPAPGASQPPLAGPSGWPGPTSASGQPPITSSQSGQGLAMPMVAGVAGAAAAPGAMAAPSQMARAAGIPDPALMSGAPAQPLQPALPPLPPMTPAPAAALQPVMPAPMTPDPGLPAMPARQVPGPVAESTVDARPAGAASTGGPPSTSGRGQQPPAPGSQGPLAQSFAHAVAICISHHSIASVDQEVLTALQQQPGYQPFVGTDATWPALHANLLHVKRSANYADYAPVGAAPVIVVLMALEQMFAQFEEGHPALSPATLKHIGEVYDSLPFEVQPGPEPPQIQAALRVLEPMSPADQELLLLFTAMLRHVMRASGVAGCEEHMVAICKWVLRLLLGPHLAMNKAAEEAALSFLWYLLRNDVAYAALILAKKRRIDRRSHKGISTPASSPNLAALEEQQAANARGAQELQQQRAAALAAGLPAMPRHSRGVLMSVSNESSLMHPHEPWHQPPQPMLLPSSAVPGAPAPLMAPDQPQFYYPDEMPVSPGVPPHVVPGTRGVSEQLSSGSSHGTAKVMPPLQHVPTKGPSFRLPPMPGQAQLPGQGLPPSRPDTAGQMYDTMSAPREISTPDPRLYGPGGDANPPPNGQPPLKSQLAGIPTAYIPPTTPGTQEVVVHDVWI